MQKLTPVPNTESNRAKIDSFFHQASLAASAEFINGNRNDVVKVILSCNSAEAGLLTCMICDRLNADDQKTFRNMLRNNI